MTKSETVPNAIGSDVEQIAYAQELIERHGIEGALAFMELGHDIAAFKTGDPDLQDQVRQDNRDLFQKSEPQSSNST